MIETSALEGVVGRLHRGEQLSDEAIYEIERLLGELRGEGWSGLIRADVALRALTDTHRGERELRTRTGRVLTDAEIDKLVAEAERGYPTDDRLCRLQIEAQDAERVGQVSIRLDELKVILCELLLRRHGMDAEGG